MVLILTGDRLDLVLYNIDKASIVFRKQGTCKRMAYYRNNKNTYKNKSRYNKRSWSLAQVAPINMAEAFPDPPSKPTLSQYGLENVDLKALEADYNTFKSQESSLVEEKDKKNRRIVRLIILFILVPGWITILQTLLLMTIDLQPVINISEFIPASLLFALMAWVYGGIAIDNPKNKVKVQFPRQKEWDNYQKYLAHQKKYADYLHTLDIKHWRNMDGYTFEREVTKLYSSLGYSTKHTGSSGDDGVDIELAKDGKRYAVQCKAHNQKIAPKVARELYGAMTAGQYDGAILVTTNGASQNTIDWCNGLPGRPIQILDASDLVEMSKSLSTNNSTAASKSPSTNKSPSTLPVSEYDVEKMVLDLLGKTAPTNPTPEYPELTDDDIPF